jgi:hypothetical protein
MIGIRAITSLLLAVPAFSCGESRSARGHICDGSASLRMAMARISNPDRLQAGQQVIFENGSVFLYVEGYWAQTADVWAGTRSGVLTDAQAAQLEADAHYADWSRGDWRTPGLFDASVDLIYDTSVKLSCSSLCGPSSAPAFVKDLSSRFEDRVRPLWSAGAPLDGQGVRIIAVRLDPGTYGFVPHASWPLTIALQSISQDAGTAQLNSATPAVVAAAISTWR